MTASVLANSNVGKSDKISLKLQYKALKSGTEDKFEAWIMTIEDHWSEEIAACIQGKFPDWRE
jgi:gas vesicle protein